MFITSRVSASSSFGAALAPNILFPEPAPIQEDIFLFLWNFLRNAKKLLTSVYIRTGIVPISVFLFGQSQSINNF